MWLLSMALPWGDRPSPVSHLHPFLKDGAASPSARTQGTQKRNKFLQKTSQCRVSRGPRGRQLWLGLWLCHQVWVRHWATATVWPAGCHLLSVRPEQPMRGRQGRGTCLAEVSPSWAKDSKRSSFDLAKKQMLLRESLSPWTFNGSPSPSQHPRGPPQPQQPPRLQARVGPGSWSPGSVSARTVWDGSPVLLVVLTEGV